MDEFEAFVRARTPALLRSAFLLTGDQQLAEDLVQGVSDDGRRVVVGMRPSDPGQVRTGSRLVDVVTGRNVPAPHTGGNDGAIYPAPGNTLLVRQDTAGRQRVYLISPALKVIDTRAEPAGLHDAMLLITPGAG